MARTLVVLLVFYVSIIAQCAQGETHRHEFVIKASKMTRLCDTKEILTVNGKFPGPTLAAHKGDQMVIKVYNQAHYNITLHWHGVRQERNPWIDGPEYINQCPIKPGNTFTYTFTLNDIEEGTVWWHAHSGWARATVHGIFIIYPHPAATPYPFPTPHAELPIILGEWWKKDVMEIPGNANKTGGEPILSDAYTINGQPGHLYPCSKQGTFTMSVKQGKTYLLRVVNAVMEEDLFFAIADHKLVVVGTDGSYTKPFETNFIMITPGQTMDILVNATQHSGTYFMAARSYSSAFGSGFDNTTTTAIFQYDPSLNRDPNPILPILPPYNATIAANDFTNKLRSLANKENPIDVPLKIDTHLTFTLSVNLINCTNGTLCTGPFGKRFAASMNNISFVTPNKMDLLSAYYFGIKGVYDEGFPKEPPFKFNYTGENLPESVLTPEFGTKVLVLEYGAQVEVVLQGTNIVASDNHPIHFHGYSFYVVGSGVGNFDPKKDPLRYNLVDPPKQNTVGVPKNGWAAIRFTADNPGVWLMHCHLERHQSWGMTMVFLVKNGFYSAKSQMFSPPPNLPPC